MINRKLVETPVKMMNRMEEITDLICEYNEEVQKQLEEKDKEIEDLKQKNDYLNDLETSAVEYKELKQEIERLNNIIKEAIEYIESYMPNYDFDKTNLLILLEILGSDKE